MIPSAIVFSLIPLVLPTHMLLGEPVHDGGARDPRQQPLTLEDALFVIPGVTGRILLVGDLDGDCHPDLMAECGGNVWVDKEAPARIEAFSAIDGRRIRTLWSATAGGSMQFDWDAGGDLDGDGISDLIIGLPHSSEYEERAGKVLIISGANGELLREVRGSFAQEHFGYTVAFLDDLDDDHLAEYAIGAPACDPVPLNVSYDNVAGFSSWHTNETDEYYVTMKDGSKVTQEEFWQKGMDSRSNRPGSAYVYSGKTGEGRWRMEGNTNGHAFASRMKNAGDVDRDGWRDLLIAPDNRSPDPVMLVSGGTGQVINSLINRGGGFGSAGDVDGDLSCDIFVAPLGDQRTRHDGTTSILSHIKGTTLLTLKFADYWSKYSTAVALGDVDGDGTPDFLMGEPDFHIRGPDGPGIATQPVPSVVRDLTLEEALKIPTNPWNSFNLESGTAWIYSGKTQRVIFGVWGRPGTADGIGLHGAALPDLNRDGLPEIIVVGSNAAYVFAGPGPALSENSTHTH